MEKVAVFIKRSYPVFLVGAVFSLGISLLIIKISSIPPGEVFLSNKDTASDKSEFSSRVPSSVPESSKSSTFSLSPSTTEKTPEPKVKGAKAPLLDINRASPSELEELPFIGPVIAKRIVDYRSAHGSFKSVHELVNVKGIGEKLLARIGGLVVVRE